MKILNTQQIQQADAYTIEHKQIASIDLMEQASLAFVDELFEIVPNTRDFCIICGSGNNGGDGLAIARILAKQHYNVTVYCIEGEHAKSKDFICNYERLQQTVSPIVSISIHSITNRNQMHITENCVIIDALFGTGLHSPIQGIAKDCIVYINSLQNTKISVDIPSGLYCDKPQADNDTICKVHHTISFQYPKLSFLFAENEQYVGDWSIVPIGVSKEFEATIDIPFNFTMQNNIQLQKKSRFAHKGTFGHALLVAGSIGKAGAAVLASKACIRSGCGLVTTHIPHNANIIMQTAIPEVMTSLDTLGEFIGSIPDAQSYSAVGIGPGIGTHPITQQAAIEYITHSKIPLILDADALNIVALHKTVLQQLPYETILTPHPGEFDRLTKKHDSSFERLHTQIELSKQTGCVVVLKGKYTSISHPNGQVWFNSTGNYGMATAGSGDVLTGIILSLKTQGYSAFDAAVYGVYIHGIAGDLALQKQAPESIIASSIIEFLGEAFFRLLVESS